MSTELGFGDAHLVAPESCIIEGDVEILGTCTIGRGVRFIGKVTLHPGCVIGAWSTLHDSVVGADSQIGVRTRLHGTTLGKNVRIGNGCRLRPTSVVGDGCQLGSGSELKQAVLAEGVVLAPGALVLDAEVGAGATFDAHAATANYDGTSKHLTSVGAASHIEANTVLVAPVTIGDNCLIGGTQSRKVEANHLACPVERRDVYQTAPFAQPHMATGESTFAQPSSDTKLTVGADCQIAPDVIVIGEITLGDRVTIGSETVLINCQIDADTQVRGGVYIEDCTIASEASIGHGAQLHRSTLGAGTSIGAFAHLENTALADAQIASHSILQQVSATAPLSTAPFTVATGSKEPLAIPTSTHLEGVHAPMHATPETLPETPASTPAQIQNSAKPEHLTHADQTPLPPSAVHTATSIEEAIDKGLDFANPQDCTIEGTLRFGDGITIAGRFFASNATIGSNTRIGAGVYLIDSSVGENADLADGTVLHHSTYQGGATLGVNSFVSHSHLEEQVHTGFRAVIIDTRMGAGSKCGHSAFFCHADIGTNVNCAACSHTDVPADLPQPATRVDDSVFVGLFTNLKQGSHCAQGSKIAASSTVRTSTRPNKLFITRPRQHTLAR